jgi:hypothetical protein
VTTIRFDVVDVEGLRRFVAQGKEETVNVIRRAANIEPMTYKRYDTPLSIYIAARYGRKEEAVGYAELLTSRGYTVTSSWVYQVEDEMLHTEGEDAAGRFAQKDWDEIRAADMIVALSESENNKFGRGGRHVEFGYAAGLNKILCVVGPLENLFHYHPSVLQFNNFDSFMQYLVEETTY